MKVARSIADVRAAVGVARAAGHHVGFVPTMGALHEGHVAIFRQARGQCGFVAASIFVNPKQFNDPKDLAAYPRPEQRDAEMARGAGVDLLFIPPVSEIYPEGHATSIEVAGAASGFEGDRRPGHFAGVATVCLKLFNIVAPDLVYFGQKDAQQVAVMRQLIRDMNLPISLEVAPTVRDQDGLALSSRNARLSAEDRRRALAIPRALNKAIDAYHAGEDPVRAARTELGDLEVEYVDLAAFDGQKTLVVAARAGATRLIDNVPVERPDLAGFGQPESLNAGTPESRKA